MLSTTPRGYWFTCKHDIAIFFVYLWRVLCGENIRRTWSVPVHQDFGVGEGCEGAPLRGRSMPCVVTSVAQGLASARGSSVKNVKTDRKQLYTQRINVFNRVGQ